MPAFRDPFTVNESIGDLARLQKLFGGTSDSRCRSIRLPRFMDEVALRSGCLTAVL